MQNPILFLFLYPMVDSLEQTSGQGSIPPKPPRKQGDFLARLLQPSKKKVFGAVAIASVGGIIYAGLQLWAKKNLPSLIEAKAAELIKRPVKLKAIESISPIGLELRGLSIPATDQDQDSLKIAKIKAKYNPLAIIFKGHLPLKVSLVEPQIYLDQDKDGTWLNLDLPQQEDQDKELLIDVDVQVDLQKARIEAKPYQQDSLVTEIDGDARYNSDNWVGYDVAASIEGAKATVVGQTFLDTGRTDTKLLVQSLALPKVFSLLSNSPVSIEGGLLSADLDVEIPSWQQLTSANVEGLVNLQNLSGEVSHSDQPVTAKSRLQIKGRKAELKKTEAKIGDLTAQVRGGIDLQAGYDLAIDVLPVQLASLQKTFAPDLGIPIAGEISSKLDITGAIDDPLIKGRLVSTEEITIDKEPIKAVNAYFEADLDKVILQNLTVLPAAGGAITANGLWETDLANSLKQQEEIDLSTMPLSLNLQANLPVRAIAKPYVELPTNLKVDNIVAEGNLGGTLNKPKGLLKWQLDPGEIVSQAISSPQQKSEQTGQTKQANIAPTKIAAQGEVVYFQDNVQLRNTAINVGASTSAIKGKADLKAKTWQGSIKTDPLVITPLLAQLNLTGLNLDRPITLQKADLEAKGKFDNLTPEGILASATGTTKLGLNLDGGRLDVNSQIASGKIKATLDASRLPINNFVEAVNVPLEVKTGKLDFVGEIASIFAVNSQKIDTNGFVSNLQAEILASDGSIRADGNLLNNNWQIDLKGQDINATKIVTAYLPAQNIGNGLDRLALQGNFSGDLTTLQNESVSLPVDVNNFALQSGQQSLATKGDLFFTNLLTSPDLAQVDLEVESNLDFDALPIAELVSASPSVNQLLAERVDLRGKADFDGLFQGKNLLSDSQNLENYDLTGRLSLNNLAFNQLVFDPFISGQVDIQPEKIVRVDLQGQQDVISAIAEPCSIQNCRLPYLPTSLNVSLGNSGASNSITPISVTGDRDQADFNLEIGNFPLALLNLAPAKSFGIEGALAGKVTGAVSANLDTLATRGNINVEKPAIGHLNTKNLQADFAYDSRQQLASVDSASLSFGNTQYNFNAGLNLKTGAIDGRLDIPQAYVQDIFSTLGWYSIEDALALFQKPEYIDPKKIETKEVLTVEESISQKLNLLSDIEKQLQAIAEKRRANSIPTELDIQGEYQGEFVVDGTIDNPEVDFEIAGNQWQWRSQKRIFDFQNNFESNTSESKQDNKQTISIGQVLAQGQLQGDTLNLEQAKLQVEDTLFSANGKLSPRTQDAKFKVDNLNVDTISKFVTVPVNVTGRVDSEGSLQGTVEQPKVDGTLTISDSTFNDAPLPMAIAGDYSYAQKKLNFQTTAPSFLQVAATVPYPIEPNTNDRLTASAKIESAAFAFLNAFTGGNLDWVGGEGNANVQATANLDLARNIPIYNLKTTGVVNLDQANVNLYNPFFTAPILASGKIALDDQLLKIETLNATFADKDVSLSGVLPLLSPVAGLNEPLRIDIPEGKIKIDKLYKGKVAGNIELTSTALKPNIGGEILLKDGNATIPKADPKVVEAKVTEKVKNLEQNVLLADSNTSPNSSSLTVSNVTEESLLVPNLDDFLIKLDKFKVQQSPLYKFGVDGQLLLNGIANQPETIKPQGTINVKQGDVSWLSNNFTLVRDRQHKLVFSPTESIFNPYIDVHMQTEISEVENVRQLDGLRNEVPDDLSRSSRTETINIVLAIDGNAAVLLPGLNSTATNNCNIRPNDQPPQNNFTYSKSELDSLATCINSAAFETGNARQIVDSQEISLSSTPNRRQGEIINLLGTQLVNFAEKLQSSDGEELVGLGVSQFVVAPIQRSVFYRLEDVVVGTGKKIGLDYLRIYPNLEGIYELNSNSSVRSTYDYVFNEVRFEYQKKF